MKSALSTWAALKVRAVRGGSAPDIPQKQKRFNAKEEKEKKMAIYHMSIKSIGRGDGRSATASAAYRGAERIADERTGLVHDYTRKSGVAYTAILALEGAPDWVANREKLWNAAEAAERRKDARVAREIEVALPMELSGKQREDLVNRFAGELVKEHGLVADIAIHKPGRLGDERNHHAHILLTTRKIAPTGLTDKTALEMSDKRLRDLGLPTAKERMEGLRERWAKLCNQSLARAGHQARVDHRSLEARGIERTAGVHLGPNVVRMERRGLPTDRGDAGRKVAEQNEEVRGISAKIIDLAEARGRMEADIKAEEQRIEAERKEAARKAEARARADKIRIESSFGDRIAAAGISVRWDGERETWRIKDAGTTALEGRSFDELAKEWKEVVRDCGAEVGVEVEAAANEAIERLEAKRKELADHAPPRENLWRLTNAKHLRNLAVWKQEEDRLEKEKSALAEDLAAARRRQSPEWRTGEAERRAVLRDPELASELAIKSGRPASPEFVWATRKENLAAAVRAWAIREKAGVEPKLKALEDLYAAHEKTCPEKAGGVLTLYRAVGYKKRHDAWMDRRRELEHDRSSLEKRLTELEEFATIESSESSAETILRFADPRLAAALDQARDRKERERQKELQKQRAEEQRREAERRKNIPRDELAALLEKEAQSRAWQHKRPIVSNELLEQYPQLTDTAAALEAIAQQPGFDSMFLEDRTRLMNAIEMASELIEKGEPLLGAKDPRVAIIAQDVAKQYGKELKLERELESGAWELDMEEDLEL